MGEDDDHDHLFPEFLKRELHRVAYQIVLTTPDQVRAHCLAAHSKRRVILTIRGRSFRYIFRKEKRESAGWTVYAKISLSRKKTLREGQIPKPIALVGHIGADFTFKRRGKSLPEDDPIIQAFREFYHLVFVRNVMRPAEMKIEAILYELKFEDKHRSD